MAEALTLAELSVDSRGIVSGVAPGNAALVGLERNIDRTAKQATTASGPFDLLTKRMFNLRTAAIALLGSFTLAGVIFQLVNLATTLVTGTDAWKQWSEAATDALKALSGGEGLIERISRHLGEAAKGTGITPGLTTSESVAKLLALRTKVTEELTKIPAGFTFGATPKDILARQVLQNDLDNIVRALVKLQEQSGLTQGQFDELFGTQLSTAIVQATRLEEGFNDTLQKTHEPVFKAVKLTGDWNEELEHAGVLLRDLTPAVDTSLSALEQWEAAVELVNRQMDALANPGRNDQIMTLGESFEDLAVSMEPARLKFELILAAVNQFAAQVSIGLTEGGLTIRSFIADMLKMVGQMLLAWGALAVITTYFTGYPGFHVAFAAIAAGVAALLAARLIGGGRESIRQAPAAQGAATGGAGTSLSVTFAGPVFGFNEAMFARYINDLQRRGERSGA